MRVTLFARSSSGEPYPVTFAVLDGKLVVACECPAGVHGQLCKHKLGLASGDDSFIDKEYYADGGRADAWREDMDRAMAMAAKTSLPYELASHRERLADIDKEVARLKREEKNLKAALARALKYGVSFPTT